MLFGPSATLVSLCLSIFSFSPATCAQQVRQPSVEYTQDTAFRDSILNVTNTYRKQHNATRLVWNDTLADYAGEWSGECKFGHSGGPYGENLAAGYENASASVIAWGEEREEYNFRGGDFSPGTGHFTQLVWKTTSQVGCSRKECNAGEPDGEGDAPGWYVVCEYSPAGNVIGTFQENVQAKLPKDAETCPQGAVCGAASALRGSIGALWIALL
ncbi:CAP domain-containing protein [Pyrenochaeta sp. MPI-SDFR-AT-0127]|nr:CAP domain-containing protein [Pyrenochaeta sp. MPI-SDFR-AT-0127]